MGRELQPYVGPRPFEQKDKAFFFGRDNEARDLLSLVIAYNVVLVYAQSGTGKTSLLNAKLIPMLEENGFEVLPIARVMGTATERVKNDDISNIYVFNALMNLSEGKYETEQTAKMSLDEYLKLRKHKKDEDGFPLPCTVIFDQFEEIFSLYQDRWKDRKKFFSQISEALKDPLLRIVFVIREDYLAQLDLYAPILPDKLRTRFHLEHLRREKALLAVKEPLKYTERYFAKGVAEKLVNDLLNIRVKTADGDIVEAAGEFLEAVQLQAVCQSLWNELPENETEITLQHLKMYGNVEKTLSRFYDESIQAASKSYNINEAKLRTWCEEVLITSMGTRGMVYRGAQLTSGMPNEVIDILENKRLIHKEERSGVTWYELTHDSFIKPIRTSNEIWKKQQMEGIQQQMERIQQDMERIGHSPVGGIGILSIALYIVFLLAGFLIVLTTIISIGLAPEEVSILGFILPREARMVLVVALSGAFGGLVHSLRSFYWYLGNRKLVWSWVGMYILMPFLGSALGVVFYLVMRGSFFPPQVTVEQTNPFGFAALAALVGLFSEQVVLKLKQVAETVFTTASEGKNS